MRKLVVVLALSDDLVLLGLSLDLADSALPLGEAQLQRMVIKNTVLQTFHGILSSLQRIKLNETETSRRLRVVCLAHDLD